jgi:hypothetical protein
VDAEGKWVDKKGDVHECRCRRNGVFQDQLEGYVNRYLEETGKRLELLTGDLEAGNLTGRLEAQEAGHWRTFRDGIERLTNHLMVHHPEEDAALLEDFARQAAEDEANLRAAEASSGYVPGTLAKKFGRRLTEALEAAKKPNPNVATNDFVEACVACYRANFDPAGLTAEIGRLEAEHTAMMEQWADLPMPRAKEKAQERFAALEARIDELKQQQEDAGEVVTTAYREMYDLKMAIAKAKLAMKSEAGEQALRQRAEAIRAVVQRIECTFVATGQTGGGWGRKNARLAKVTIYPVVGDSVEFTADSASPGVRSCIPAPTPA